jgi:diacylglycerol kinase (ATP)
VARLRKRPEAHPRADDILGTRSSPLSSFRYAFAGLVWAWRKERNLRIECGIGAMAFLLSLALGVSPVPILLAATMVLGLELINSALEAAIDLVTPDFHPLAKIAKDLSAASVLVASLGAVLVGLATLGPALLRVVSSQ